MKKILFTAWVFALCGNVQAGVIIGNSVIGPYQVGTNRGIKSVGFLTGPAALLLDNIQVALGGHDSGGGSLTFTLNADAAGTPGGVIGTIGSQTVAGLAPTAAYMLTPASSLSLAANTTYWIQVAFPSSGAPPAWDRTDPAFAPASGLAPFIRYDINGSTSGTFNAMVVN